MRVGVLVAVLAVASVDASATRVAAGDLARGLVGTWRLVSTEQRLSDGTVRPSPLYGPKGVGYLIYGPSGRMCAMLMDPSRARWKAEDSPTDAELRATFEHFVAYCGRYEVNDKEKAVIHHVEMDLVPNSTGVERKRYAELAGNRLKLRPAEALASGVVEYTLTWERLEATK
jgi:lipocalin-like protein